MHPDGSLRTMTGHAMSGQDGDREQCQQPHQFREKKRTCRAPGIRNDAGATHPREHGKGKERQWSLREAARVRFHFNVFFVARYAAAAAAASDLFVLAAVHAADMFNCVRFSGSDASVPLVSAWDQGLLASIVRRLRLHGSFSLRTSREIFGTE
jgi:hypothetical protein